MLVLVDSETNKNMTSLVLQLIYIEKCDIERVRSKLENREQIKYVNVRSDEK